MIGRYCAIASGTRFLMAGAAHPTMGVSTFPFTMFGGTWTEKTLDIVTGVFSRGDTIVGNDVWFGYGALVMPGVRIGDGAIIAADAVRVDKREVPRTPTLLRNPPSSPVGPDHLINETKSPVHSYRGRVTRVMERREPPVAR
ncbi:MAG TPA: hypothetical protein VFX61_01650 [Micromonosporaceae bacterium]|nr:hypothetical protein [Micromonosporaceae bacterium]